jgi:hypothetical protein
LICRFGMFRVLEDSPGSATLFVRWWRVCSASSTRKKSIARFEQQQQQQQQPRQPRQQQEQLPEPEPSPALLEVVVLDRSATKAAPSWEVPSPVPFPFSWDDVDLTQKGNCGSHKCFFRSVSNDTLGYLVAPKLEFHKMKKASLLVTRLEENFGAKHFMADEPLKVKVSKSLIKTLNRLVDNPQRREKGIGQQEDMFDMSRDGTKSRLAIQKVIVAPDNTLFFAHSRSGRLVTEKQLPDFALTIPDKEAFRHQLLVETIKLERIFQEEPMLAWDFQPLIDTAGNVYHIDLDGHLSHSYWDFSQAETQKEGALCVDFLREVEDVITNLALSPVESHS